MVEIQENFRQIRKETKSLRVLELPLSTDGALEGMRSRRLQGDSATTTRSIRKTMGSEASKYFVFTLGRSGPQKYLRKY